MATTQDLIAKATAELQSRPGYRFNPRVLEEIITAGVVPDRAIIQTGQDVVAVYYADRIAKVRLSDKVETGSMPMTPALHEMALLQYAKREAEQAVKAARTQSHSI
jgi:hypothetical protein